MGVKFMINIKDELYDMWEVRTITRFNQYNELLGETEYFISLNREGKATNAENMLVLCESEEDREKELKSLKERLDEFDNIVII